jgi:hypothetical protein
MRTVLIAVAVFVALCAVVAVACLKMAASIDEDGEL